MPKRYILNYITKVLTESFVLNIKTLPSKRMYNICYLMSNSRYPGEV